MFLSRPDHSMIKRSIYRRLWALLPARLRPFPTIPGFGKIIPGYQKIIPG
jgi:hypothetical protein